MKKVVLTILLLLLAAGAGAGCYYKFVYEPQNGSIFENGIPFIKKTAEENEETVSVDSVAAIAGIPNASGIIQRYAGVVETQEEWKAKTDGDRKIETTYVKEGDMVKVGDPLFKYDTSADKRNIEKNEIALERLANDSESRTTKIGQLEKQVAATKEEEERLSIQTQILGEQNQIKQNAYEAKTTQQEIDTLEEGVENATVKSEIEGVVKSVGKKSSSSMGGSDDDAYVTIMAVGDLRVRGYANEQNISLIEEGMPVVAYSRVNPELTWTGVITLIKREGEKSSDDESSYYGGGGGDGATTSSKYPFYVSLDETDGLMLGQHLYLEKDVGQTDGKDGIRIDDYYFEEEDGAWFVWAENDKGRIEKRAVELGEYDEEQMKYEVLSGLTAEDYIAVPGQDVVEGRKTVRTEYGADDESALNDYGYEFETDDFEDWVGEQPYEGNFEEQPYEEGFENDASAGNQADDEFRDDADWADAEPDGTGWADAEPDDGEDWDDADWDAAGWADAEPDDGVDYGFDDDE